MDVFAIPVLAEMDSTVTARKPCFWRSSKTVSMITVSISSGRRRFTDLLSFSILFDIATPGPRCKSRCKDQLLVITDATLRCVASKNQVLDLLWMGKLDRTFVCNIRNRRCIARLEFLILVPAAISLHYD